MSVPVQQDHVELGLDRLLSQWDDSPIIKGLLTSWLEEANELEELLFQLLTERGIFDAVGAQLDVLGALFGLARDGRTDDQYRQAILNKITVIGADGTTEVFMQVLRTSGNTDFVDFFEHNSGDVHAYMGDGYGVFTYPDLQDSVAAGVNLRIYIDNQFDCFVAAELLDQVSDLQTNNNEDIQVTDGVNTYDLQVQQQIFDTDSVERAVLPEVVDTLERPLAELLFSAVKVTSGNIVDDLGNLLIDDLQNNIIWVDYAF